MNAPDLSPLTEHDAFHRLLAGFPEGSLLTIDTIRDDVTYGLQIRETSRGGLLGGACRADLIEPAGYKPSTHPDAKGRPVRVYRRTNKQVDA